MGDENLTYAPQGDPVTNDVSGFSRRYLHERDDTSVTAAKEIVTFTRDFKWLPAIISRLNELLQLDANWDSYGANRVQPEFAKNALWLLYDLMSNETPIPSLIPTPEGHLQIEWHTRGIDLEVEIESAASFHVSYEDKKNNQEWEGDLQYDVTQLATFIRELSTR